MIIDTGSRHLQCIWNVIQGQVNDIIICKELNTIQNTLYTLWIIKDHETSKKILKIYADWKETEPGYTENFSMGQNLCFIFPYFSERPFNRFYINTIDSGTKPFTIWKNYVKSCMAVNVPFPILFMLIEQGQIQLSKDGNVYFNYAIDLADFNMEIHSPECTEKCAEELLKLFRKDAGDLQGYELVSSKLLKHQYSDLTQLYRDIKLITDKQTKNTFLQTICQGVQGKDHILFCILLFISMVLLITVIVITLSHMLYGEIPIFRIFQPLFQEIGTESLLQ